MGGSKRGRKDAPNEETSLVPLPHGRLPGEVVVRTITGLKPMGRTAVKHGFHCADAIEIPTSLTCSVCPLYLVKKRDKRHDLACPEGRKGQVCPILMARQIAWAEELVAEVREITGRDPMASDRARIEQIVRHRSRLFQSENYLKVAGFLDLREGVVRNVGERLITLENALSRSLGEFRQALSDRRQRQPEGPRLEEYLEVVEKGKERETDD